jgi:hypothetical protein
MFEEMLAAIPRDYEADLRKIADGIDRGAADSDALKAACQALDRINNVAKELRAIGEEYDDEQAMVFFEFTLTLDVAVEGIRTFVDNPVDDPRKQAKAVIFMEAIRELISDISACAADEVGAPES